MLFLLFAVLYLFIKIPIIIIVIVNVIGTTYSANKFRLTKKCMPFLFTNYFVIHLFIYCQWVYIFIYLFTRVSFIYSFLRFLIYGFIHLFIHLFICIFFASHLSRNITNLNQQQRHLLFARFSVNWFQTPCRSHQNTAFIFLLPEYNTVKVSL